MNIVFLDSYYQLPFKLEVLGIKFKTEKKKACFHTVLLINITFFIKARTPSYSFLRGQNR